MAGRCKWQPRENAVRKLLGPHINGSVHSRLELEDGRGARVQVLCLWICTAEIQFVNQLVWYVRLLWTNKSSQFGSFCVKNYIILGGSVFCAAEIQFVNQLV